MKKRAGLARALAMDPDVLFFDEPSAGLDPITSSRLDDLILNLRDGLGATIVIVSHELPSLFAIADDGMFLDAETRTAIAHGSPAALRDTCPDPQVEAFMRRERPEALVAGKGAGLKGVTNERARTDHSRRLRAGRPAARPGGGGLLRQVQLLQSGDPRRDRVPGTSIAGLSVGSAVTFRGVPIGSVESIAIQFDPRTSVALIPVIIRIEPERTKIERPSGTSGLELPELIKRGLRAELNVQSFVTGQSQIDLDFDPGSEPVLHPDISKLPEIPTRQSTIQKAKEQLSQLPLHELADNATNTLASLRGLSEKLDQDLPPLVESLKTTSDHSAQMVEAATQAIKDLQARMDTTLADVSRLSVSADTQMNQRGAELRTLLATTNQAMTQARDLLSEVRSATASRAPDRANLDAALRDIAAAAAALRGFAGDIERNPQLLLTGRRP